jgi:hypothetical protein
MRTYGRRNGAWVVVETDANGFDDNVMITTLAQCLALSPGEDPFHADVGIPAQQSVVTQIYPDYYVALMQKKFSQYFAILTILRKTSADGITPEYQINAVSHQGAVISNLAVI